MMILTTLLVAGTTALPLLGTVSQISSFSIPKSPSGMFFDSASALLYILCGTQTNNDHFLYAYTTAGEQKCLITIPQAAGMSRVDGFYIVDDKAYIVDSQGPIYAESGKLGGSIYVVDWTENPCGCADGACAQTSVSWMPTVSKTISIDGTTVGDGGGNDDFFRNSGIVVMGEIAYAVNGMHPNPDLTCCYPKSLVKVGLDKEGDVTPIQRWAFDAQTIGHDVDMEGLTCGEDNCDTNIYIGDEYNYIYRLDLNEPDANKAITVSWDLRALVGDVPADKGIESLTYAASTGYFYAGIQETMMVHVVQLDEPLSTEPDATSVASCELDSSFPACNAPVVTSKRVRREVRTLSAEEFDAVANAMWVMKKTSLSAGQNLYGEHFKPYDYFVARHAIAQTDSRGDQAHFGPHFSTWHAAFNLEFELSLLSIDPSIGAMPYWDQTQATPSIFTDDLLGIAPTTDATERQLRTGKFADWPIAKSSVLADFASFYDETSSPYTGSVAGFLRSADNTLATSFVTRFGTSDRTYDENSFWLCSQASKTWQQSYTCLEGGFHSGPHGGVGGKIGTNLGDFEDPVTSPNDPLFFFHHFNMERSMYHYMIAAQSLKCTYWDYPAQRNPVGTARDDPMSSGWGFTSDELGVGDVEGAPQGLWTHADVLCWMNPSSAGYTYDSVIACAEDRTTCTGIPTSGSTMTGTCTGMDSMGNDCSARAPRNGQCPPGCTLTGASPSAPAASTGACSGTDDMGVDCSTRAPRMGQCPPGCTLDAVTTSSRSTSSRSTSIPSTATFFSETTTGGEPTTVDVDGTSTLMITLMMPLVSMTLVLCAM